MFGKKKHAEDKIDKLVKRVEELERLERELRCVWWGIEIKNTTDKMSLLGAVQDILDHLGLEYEHAPRIDKLKKKKKG